MAGPRFLQLILALGALLAVVSTSESQPPAPAPCAAGPGTYAGTAVSWADVSGETGYRLYRNGTLIAVLPPDAVSYLDLDFSGPGTFNYCVEAFDGVGTSPQCCATRVVATPLITVERKHWFNDCFPSNETIVPLNSASFDTAAAWIRTGSNLAQLTGNSSRQDLPGDTVLCDAPGASRRVDLVFRIYPGVGNYGQIGNRAKPMRRVPTSPTEAVPNAASTNFWESYLADNGAVGTGGNGASGPGHPGGVWGETVWNSARCDTSETNIFPAESRLVNLPGLAPGRFASMYHESDPRYSTLGVAKKRCFLIDPSASAPINSTNITCGTGTYPPIWTIDVSSGLPVTEGGLPQGQTREFTQILPDGQLTPGAHVQYFLRLSDSSAPLALLGMDPDTNVALPQLGSSLDGKRWEDFGVLPDRWKDPGFGGGGTGMACMLVINFDPDEGDQRAFDAVADSGSATYGVKSGAYNGLGKVPPGADPNDPAYFVRSHRGQAGSTWDLYRVRGSRDTLTGNAGAPGGRGGPRCMGCPSAGRESRQGPTPTMLRTFYRALMILSGDRNALILGPTTNRGQDDVALLQDFVVIPGGTAQPRGLSAMGSGFAESEQATHPAFLGTYLAGGLRSPDYAALSGNAQFRLLLHVPVVPTFPDFEVVNHEQPVGTGRVLDVLNVNAAITEAVAHAFYENVGAAGPYVAAVQKGSSATRNWEAMLQGWDIKDFAGFQLWRYFVWQPYSTGNCAFPSPSMSVNGGPRPSSAGLLSVRNSPLTSGAVSLRFTLPRPSHVKLTIHDVSGRLLRVLIDAQLEVGAHEIRWDGIDARGQRVAKGVYFARGRFEGRLEDVEKIVILE